MKETMYLTFASSFAGIEEFDSRFDRGVMRVAYPGDNRNGSSIAKEDFERAIGTIYNCPIVCNYDRETDTLGGHDMELAMGVDGSMRIVNATDPVGVVPESAGHHWEWVTDEDGVEREYLCVDALLWKRQEAYRKIKNDGITAQSMEITVNRGKKIDGVYHIYDFTFEAFCLIGVEPEYLNRGISAAFSSALMDMFRDHPDIRVADIEQALRYAVILLDISDDSREDFDELLLERSPRGTYWLHFAVRPSDNRRKVRLIQSLR